jgi:hypothetical protein
MKVYDNQMEMNFRCYVERSDCQERRVVLQCRERLLVLAKY